jgi:hypothetical protein
MSCKSALLLTATVALCAMASVSANAAMVPKINISFSAPKFTAPTHTPNMASIAKVATPTGKVTGSVNSTGQKVNLGIDKKFTTNHVDTEPNKSIAAQGKGAAPAPKQAASQYNPPATTKFGGKTYNSDGPFFSWTLAPDRLRNKAVFVVSWVSDHRTLDRACLYGRR